MKKIQSQFIYGMFTDSYTNTLKVILNVNFNWITVYMDITLCFVRNRESKGGEKK